VSADATLYRRAPVSIPAESCAAFLSRTATDHADRVALVHEGREIRYSDLAGMVAAARRILSGAGLAKGSRLAVSMGLSPRQIAVMFAAFDLGVIVVPVYDSAPAEEVRAKCRAAAVDALAVDPEAAGARAQQIAGMERTPRLLAIEELDPSGHGLPPQLAPGPDDLAFMPFSSGSTGEPKLILLTHRNVLASRLLFADATRLVASSVLAHFLPLAHVYGWMALTAALGQGATVVLRARYDFAQLVEDIERHRIEGMFGVSQVILDMERLTAGEAARLKSLSWVNTGTAPLAPSIMTDVSARLGITVTTGYGLTEAAPVTHSSVERPDLIDVGTIGFATANTRLRLIDPDDPARPHRPGAPGELVVSGPQVAAGYAYADGRLDRGAWLDDGSLRTGDLVEFDAQGRVKIVGRIKSLIKYKGYSVVPAELEAALAAHPAVRDCTVVGMPDREAGEIPVAYVALKGGQRSSPDELIAFVRTRVAPQRAVRRVVLVDSIPRSDAGKVLVQFLQSLPQ